MFNVMELSCLKKLEVVTHEDDEACKVVMDVEIEW
jgi:hypothetical protein